MDIPWIYLVLSSIVFLLGLDILTHRRGGLHKWEKPFGYRIVYYKGKPAQIVGAIMTIFGLVFTLDAIRILLFGNVIPVLQYTFCLGSLLILAGINIFLQKYAE